MRKITDYNQLSPLLSAQLRPGVATNAVQKKEEYLFAIEAGALYVQEFPGGLYLLWRREAHWQLYFYRQRDAVLPPLEPMDMPVVLEVASRPRDAALRAMEPVWEELGFRRQFDRLRMTRPAGPLQSAPEDGAVYLAGESDCTEIRRLLEVFDPYLSCLPTRAELRRDIAQERIFMTHGGVLRTAGNELCQLAVDPALRRQGIAQKLIGAFLRQLGYARSTVWVRRYNTGAIRLYESLGFRPDGWTSVVWLLNQKG